MTALFTAPIPSLAPGALASSSAAKLSLAPACGRLSFRARGDVSGFEAALGVALPGKIGVVATNGATKAICLGPDEWAIHLPSDAVAGVLSACAQLYEAHPHSLVDISGREISLIIEGAQSAELLCIGLPRDVNSIPVGEGRRTAFDCGTVVLWRLTETSFQMDIWNSFATHLASLLAIGCRELAAEI